jgi:acyl-CoA thioester hydrolase
VSDLPPHLKTAVRIPIAWGEQDLFGHLNNVFYFRYLESARMHLLERIGVLAMHREQGLGVILAATDMRFLSPVHWPCTLTVITGVSAMGNTSFTMTYVVRDEDGATVAEGSSVQVMYDYVHHTKVRVPDEVRAAIDALSPSLS